jgi:diguanylate cyclase (GGDEF)-like protein
MSSGQFLCLAAAKQIDIGTAFLADPPPKTGPTLYLLRLALPYLAIAISLGLLVKAVVFDRDTGLRMLVILFGAVVMVALVLLRQYLVLIENMRLYQAVQRIAWTDGLTGLYNRHFFNEMLPREVERARRYNENLSVLLLDLNGFKKYNDTYGHLEGDTVLRSVARICAAQLRASDTIARFGGDEFVIILPAASRRVAQKIAERIQKTLADQKFHGDHLGVTIGIGVYRSGLTPQGLLEEADQDLYRLKADNSQ